MNEEKEIWPEKLLDLIPNPSQLRNKETLTNLSVESLTRHIVDEIIASSNERQYSVTVSTRNLELLQKVAKLFKDQSYTINLNPFMQNSIISELTISW